MTIEKESRRCYLLAYACRKGKEYENFRIRKFNDPKAKTSDIGFGRLPNSGFARTDNDIQKRKILVLELEAKPKTQS